MPNVVVTISNDLLHHATDHTPYEGQTVRGWPVMTISRGELVWDDGKVLSQPGRGQFIPRQRPFPAAAGSFADSCVMRQADNPMAERPMTERLVGKVIMITGAASGIGAAIARRCVAEGASVVCADHSSDAATNLAEALGTTAIAVRCDVTDQRSMERAVEAVRARFGRLDGLVHNAAAPSLDGTVVDLSEEQWRLEIDVSLTGAFLASKLAIPLMISGGGGSIVLIASQFGHVATGKAVAYCAAKAGVVHLAKAMAVDHAADGIRVNSLSPGAVATPRPSSALARSCGGPMKVSGRRTCSDGSDNRMRSLLRQPSFYRPMPPSSPAPTCSWMVVMPLAECPSHDKMEWISR